MDPTSRSSRSSLKPQLQFWQHNWTPGQGGHNYILIYLKILTIDMTPEIPKTQIPLYLPKGFP